jgi:hypothetical protein
MSARMYLDIGTRTFQGFLVGGKFQSSVFMGRINEPCRHQPCPYAQVRLALSSSASLAQDRYLDRNKGCPVRVLRAARYVVYEVCIADFTTASVSGDAARAFLHELCTGRADGQAWELFKDLRDHNGVEAVAFPSRKGLRDVLILQSEIERVQLTEVCPLLV